MQNKKSQTNLANQMKTLNSTVDHRPKLIKKNGSIRVSRPTSKFEASSPANSMNKTLIDLRESSPCRYVATTMKKIV